MISLTSIPYTRRRVYEQQGLTINKTTPAPGQKHKEKKTNINTVCIHNAVFYVCTFKNKIYLFIVGINLVCRRVVNIFWKLLNHVLQHKV